MIGARLVDFCKAAEEADLLIFEDRKFTLVKLAGHKWQEYTIFAHGPT